MKKNQFKNLLKKKNDIKNNKDQIWREKKTHRGWNYKKQKPKKMIPNKIKSNQKKKNQI